MSARHWALCAAVAVASTYVAMRLSGVVAAAELAVLRTWVSSRRLPPSDRVLVCYVSEDAIHDHEQTRPPGCSCPLVSRALMARAIEKLREAGAAVVVTDLTFTNPCQLHDERLSRAMERAGNVVVAMEAIVRKGVDLQPPVDSVHGYRLAASPTVYAPYNVPIAVELVQGGKHEEVETPLGTVSIVRGGVLSLALAAWCVAEGVNPEDVQLENPSRLKAGYTTIPVLPRLVIGLTPPLRPFTPRESQVLALINWWGPAGSFSSFSLEDVLSDRVPASLVRGAAVIVGDAREQRMTPAGAMSGPELQANALATLFEQRWLRLIAWPWRVAVALASAYAAAALVFGVGRWPAYVGTAAEGVGLLLLSRALLSLDRWLVVVPLMVNVAVATAIAAIVNQIQENAVRRRLEFESKRRDEVASEVFHDIRGSLAILHQNVEQLLRRIGDHAAQQVEPRIVQSIRRQLRSIEHELSTLLDADPDRVLRVRRREIDVVALVRTIAEDLDSGSPRHEITVAGETAVAEVDPGLLSRAVRNLVHNAVKYSPDGGPVEVEVRPRGPMVVISVTDHGIGIEPAKQQQLFQRFSRAVPAGTDIPGVGLGLYAVRRIVEAHGGSVTVYSEPNVGSTFTIFLPARAPGSEDDTYETGHKR